MFEAVELPTSVTDLDTGLTDVDWNALSHFRLILVLLLKIAKDVYEERLSGRNVEIYDIL